MDSSKLPRRGESREAARIKAADARLRHTRGSGRGEHSRRARHEPPGATIEAQRPDTEPPKHEPRRDDCQGDEGSEARTIPSDKQVA